MVIKIMMTLQSLMILTTGGWHKKDEKPQENSAEGSRHQPLIAFTIIYGVMALIGLAGMGLVWDSLEKATTLPSTSDELISSAVAPLIAAAALLAFSWSFEQWFASWRRLRNFIMQMFGNYSVAALLWMAALSATAEELFFRGALQPLAGVAATSIIFGLLHIGPDRKISAWTIWTIGAGVVLGLLYENTESILAPILAHFTVNAWSLLGIRMAWQKKQVNKRRRGKKAVRSTEKDM